MCTTGHSVRQCNRNHKTQFFDSEKFWTLAFDHKQPITGQRITYTKNIMSMSCILKPTIQSCDTGWRIPFSDSCQFTITWMSTIKLNADGLCLGYLARNAWSFQENLSRLALISSNSRIKPKTYPQNSHWFWKLGVLRTSSPRKLGPLLLFLESPQTYFVWINVTTRMGGGICSLQFLSLQ